MTDTEDRFEGLDAPGTVDVAVPASSDAPLQDAVEDTPASVAFSDASDASSATTDTYDTPANTPDSTTDTYDTPAISTDTADATSQVAQQEAVGVQQEAAGEEHPHRAYSAGRGAIELVIMIAVAILLTWGITTFIVQPFEIPSGSMETTIDIGDRVLSEKISFHFSTPQKGEIVTFANPDGSDTTLIKRVIAVGGQTVDLQDGHVVVDGVTLDEPYTNGLRSDPLKSTLNGMDISYPYVVPDGYIWVMGDNRTNSADSRYFGAVPISSVSGHAFFKYWPFTKIGPLN